MREEENGEMRCRRGEGGEGVRLEMEIPGENWGSERAQPDGYDQGGKGERKEERRGSSGSSDRRLLKFHVKWATGYGRARKGEKKPARETRKGESEVESKQFPVDITLDESECGEGELKGGERRMKEERRGERASRRG